MTFKRKQEDDADQPKHDQKPRDKAVKPCETCQGKGLVSETELCPDCAGNGTIEI